MNGRRESTQGLLTVAAILLSSALNYAFTLLLGRWLDAAQYGAFASFTSLFMLSAALPIAFQQATSRRAQGANTPAALRAGGLLGAALLLLSPLAGLLGLHPAWVAAFALTVPPLALLGAWRGAAQRDGRAAAFGLSLLAEHGLKIALTAPLLLVLPGAAAAVAATLLGMVLALPLVRPRPAPGAAALAAPEAEGKRLLALVAAAQSGLLYGDVLLAGALLPPGDAGAFAAAATLARVVFFAGWAVQVAAFPLVARRAAAGEPLRPLLLGALGATLAVAGIPAALLALEPELCARVAFGGALPGAAALLPAAALGTLALTVAGTALNHLLASGGRGAQLLAARAYLLSGAALLLLALASGHQAAHLTLLAAVGKGTLLLSAAPLLIPHTWRFTRVVPRV
ncbi:hypothetical protein [Deinococcus soli (ex Cha et al. 2016)]|uniref:O-antigen/teichoic acid export membrane protein n=2 Tax=Deinococcus soli (ex Cha et al. 2016) TaxID=1309411 RepID=A0ACC6KER5_9DEIO|nr:hypothetical protein [Deinococcus soli (ex Cha et al. 2016)]MDR6217799.1 O-antigen/teichoic acid export membrane protein [Deinococcus soli (ex Cha et al. 2016)]MDR6328049.1 O-antigen/teichoic acid export membrane protein [Deinococcus soli (ex Cha et al. 2016)]MDR6750901.1 O-antigen/teichoic acid export membrane protein [Deinococcus soli (ex Cha et al. 2016)]